MNKNRPFFLIWTGKQKTRKIGRGQKKRLKKEIQRPMQIIVQKV